MLKHLPFFCCLCLLFVYSQNVGPPLFVIGNVVSLTAESPLSAVFCLVPRKTAPSGTLRNLIYAKGDSGV
jgi:hypothetical protein